MTSFKQAEKLGNSDSARASTANGSANEEDVLQNIKDVRKKFMEQTDASLAHKLQNEEYKQKYNWNREDRRTARQDVPLARRQQTEEEQRLEIEKLEHHEKHKKIAEQDAIIAAKMQAEEKRRRSSEKDSLEEDTRIAMQLQKEELLAIERDKMRREKRDQDMARQMQQTERQIKDISVRDAGSSRRSSESSVSSDRSRAGTQRSLYRTSDLYDLSEEEQKKLCMMQDEEIARALQERENMKARRSGKSSTSTSGTSKSGDLERELDRKNDEINRLLKEKEELEDALQAGREPRGGRGGTTTTRTVREERRETRTEENNRVSRQTSEPVRGGVGGFNTDQRSVGGSRSLTSSHSAHGAAQPSSRAVYGSSVSQQNSVNLWTDGAIGEVNNQDVNKTERPQSSRTSCRQQ